MKRQTETTRRKARQGGVGKGRTQAATGGFEDEETGQAPRNTGSSRN